MASSSDGPMIELSPVDHSNSNGTGDPAATPESEPIYKPTLARWYILGVFALVGIGQTLVYSTWGTIPISAEKAFGLTQTDFALLPNWYNIAYFISVFPYMWLMQNKGLRAAMLVTAGLSALGAAIRCLNFGPYPEQYRYIIHLGHLINNLGSPLPWMGCPYVSALWFPPRERALATSLGLAFSGLGPAIGALIGPILINAFAPEVDGEPASDEAVYAAIRNLLYLESLFCQICFVIVILYFPSKPKHPPSFTAGEERTAFSKGVCDLFSNIQFWLMLAVYSISSAVFTSWQQILTIFAEPVMGEVEAGFLNFVTQMIAIFSGPILSATAFLWLEKHSKLVVVSLMFIGSAAFFIMTLSALVFPSSFTSLNLWITLSIGSLTTTAAQPIWWEMSCEAAYPVAEGIVSGVFTLASCFFSWIYFVFYMFPQLGTDWSTWTLVASNAICIPALLFYNPVNNRMRLDENAQREQLMEHERRNTISRVSLPPPYQIDSEPAADTAKNYIPEEICTEL